MCLLVVCVFSCKKDDPVEECNQSTPEAWGKFIGDYIVYDTLDNYLYDMSISHVFSGENIYGDASDSLLIENFADLFDVRFQYQLSTNRNILDIGIFDSIKDNDDNTWFLSDFSDDLNTDIRENELKNDTIVLHFLMDNTPYYIDEGRLFFRCECKHVAVKQN